MPRACTAGAGCDGDLFMCVQFTQAKADGQIRWAVLNTIAILRRHSAVHARLAEGMAAGKSVSECIALVEAALADSEDI